jgi:hypothetical protein
LALTRHWKDHYTAPHSITLRYGITPSQHYTAFQLQIAFYVVLGFAGISLEEAREAGWLHPESEPNTIQKVFEMFKFSEVALLALLALFTLLNLLTLLIMLTLLDPTDPTNPTYRYTGR